MSADLGPHVTAGLDEIPAARLVSLAPETLTVDPSTLLSLPKKRAIDTPDPVALNLALADPFPAQKKARTTNNSTAALLPEPKRKERPPPTRRSPPPDSPGRKREPMQRPPPGSARPPPAPLDISNSPGFELLDPAEQTLASQLRLQPNHYLQIKNTIVNECRKNNGIRRRQARELIKIDVNKTSRIWDALRESGEVWEQGTEPVRKAPAVSAVAPEAANGILNGIGMAPPLVPLDTVENGIGLLNADLNGVVGTEALHLELNGDDLGGLGLELVEGF